METGPSLTLASEGPVSTPTLGATFAHRYPCSRYIVLREEASRTMY